jgi:hypothetical protein
MCDCVLCLELCIYCTLPLSQPLSLTKPTFGFHHQIPFRNFIEHHLRKPNLVVFHMEVH